MTVYFLKNTAMASKKTRKSLSADGLFKLVKSSFSDIQEKKKNRIALNDVLMSAFAIFSMKDSSLLTFDERRMDHRGSNLQSIYGIEKIPSDTCIRERLDEINPETLRPVFKDLFGQAQRGKLLEDMTYLDGYYLCSTDGTGYFSSEKVHCDSCMEKTRKSTGKKEYYHQMLAAALVHPEIKEVIPLCPEPIIKQDGETKNDCERNACKRLIKKIREDHPKLKILIVEDSLASNEPHIKELEKYNMSYILGVKQADHKFLFERADESQEGEYEVKDEKFRHKFRWANQLPLNKLKWKTKVNFVEYWEEDKKTGKVKHFSWVTDLKVTKKNIYEIMRAGRARWRIENETFNTLKNQGYNFEHNFGHGDKNLSVVFAMIMMLAFSVDQIQQKACWLFKAAWEKSGSKRALWEHMRSIFETGIVGSMETILAAIAYGYEKQEIKPIYNTS